jgi:intron-binding protein aquarius
MTADVTTVDHYVPRLSGRAERGSDGSPSYTCETGALFYAKSDQIPNNERANSFPFHTCFSLGDDDELSLETVQEHLARLKMMLEELAEYRPLELLRTQRQRTDYFLIKQLRVVAMTSKHAAIARALLIS